MTGGATLSIIAPRPSIAHTMRFAASVFAIALGIPHALAAPLTPAEVTKLCSDADGASHCGRLVEAVQAKRLPGLVTRNGNDLRLSLFPTGSVTFTDVDTLSGGRSYALWDFFSEINAAVLWTTTDDATGFLLVQRAGGRQTPLPAEPVLAPDRQRLATVDVCGRACANRITIWRVAKDGVTAEMTWTPPEPWSDATLRWKDERTLVLTYTPEGESEPRTLERKLADPGWTRGQGQG